MALVIETELGTKKFEKQIANLKMDLDHYMKVLESQANIPVKLRLGTSERAELEATIEKTKNKLISLQEQAQKTGEIGEQAGERSGRGFEKGITSLKRFALSLFGIRSAFSLVRRATSTYLNQHEDTANKINAIWVALGNALAPIIEAIADMVLKFIGYLNVFLQALGFDVDLTKGMNKSTKAIGGTTKAMKELNNQVATFDEMNVMQKESSTSGGGVGGGISSGGGFEMPKLNEDVVRFLKETAKLLKENWDWISKILLLIAGIKIAKWLTGMGSVLDILKIAGTIGIIALGVDLIYDAITGRDLIEDLKEIIDWSSKMVDYYKQIADQQKKNVKETKKWIDSKQEETNSYKKGSKEMDTYFGQLVQIADSKVRETRATAKYVDGLSGLEYAYEDLTGTVSSYNDELDANYEGLKDCIQEMGRLYTQGQLTEEQEKIFLDVLSSVNGELVDGNVEFGKLHDNVLDASKETKKYTEVLQALGTEEKTTKEQAQETWGGIKTIVDNENSKMKRSVQDTWGGITSIIQGETNRLNNTSATVKIKADTSQFQQALNKIGKTQGMSAVLGVGVASTLANIKFAKGGIFYNPGKGVSMTNVVVGEATGGAEGVVPLNNEQSMDLIGQSIAKHLVINLTNTTMLDNKVIAREQRKIESENNFATNGRGVL